MDSDGDPSIPVGELPVEEHSKWCRDSYAGCFDWSLRSSAADGAARTYLVCEGTTVDDAMHTRFTSIENNTMGNLKLALGSLSSKAQVKLSEKGKAQVAEMRDSVRDMGTWPAICTCSNSGDPAGAVMERWTGVLHVPVSRGGPLFRVAASLVLSTSKALAIPRANAILFTGDRVRETGEPAIERLSDAAYLAALLAGKLTGEANVWVVDAPCFAGPFAVYRELVPSVDTVGNPKRYDPTDLPAAAGVANILEHCIGEIQNIIKRDSLKDLAGNQDPTASFLSCSPPRTIILGFSKGGVVVNQLMTELSCWASKSSKAPVDVPQRSQTSLLIHNLLVPATASDVLSSISGFHYVDVGLNCAGAYITDHTVIKGIANYVSHTGNDLGLVLHGTPRQWSDPNRSWIRKERDTMLQLFQEEAKKCDGRLLLSEKKYFDDRPPSLLMHFEILEVMDIG